VQQDIYFFGGGKAEGNGQMKDILGGKGAGLAEMTNAGIPSTRGGRSPPGSSRNRAGPWPGSRR
jgi:hypothetical protein